MRFARLRPDLRVVSMTCGTCGHDVSGRSAQAVSAAYFDHREAVHGQPSPPPLMTAVAILAKGKA